MVHDGWHQIAFESDIVDDLTPVEIGQRRLLIVRAGDLLRVVDADCPHRGAHLAAGQLARNVVVCPFHGYRIGLDNATDAECDHGLRVRSYPSLVAAGAVFACLSDTHDRGLNSALQDLLAKYWTVGSLTYHVNCPASLVSENGFDAAHFRHVHDIHRVLEFATCSTADGALIADGLFEISVADRLQPEAPRSLRRISYRCTAFAPGLVLSYLGGDFPYAILTGATPTRTGGTTLRLTFALPPGAHNAQTMLAYFRAGLEKDRAIWETLAPSASSRFTPHDSPVIAFRRFCTDFEAKEPL